MYIIVLDQVEEPYVEHGRGSCIDRNWGSHLFLAGSPL